MARQMVGPRKQRTRQHVIADQSVNHVERFIIDEGHTAQRLEKDYGYDLLLFTFDEQGYAEPGLVSIQLKATENLQTVGTDYVFDVDIRDYNRWMVEEFPVILVLFDASRRRAWWLDFQRYFHETASGRPKKGAKSVRVHVLNRQVMNRRAIAKMRDLKWQARIRIAGEPS
jgi:Domain of unknown function (DUF4365)